MCAPKDKKANEFEPNEVDDLNTDDEIEMETEILEAENAALLLAVS